MKTWPDSELHEWRNADLHGHASSDLSPASSFRWNAWIDFFSKRQIASYCLAVVSTIAAILVRMALDPILGEEYPYITFMFAIILTAWYGGVKPSMVALVLGFMSAAYFFKYPRGSVEVYGLDDQVGMVLYITVGFSSILFSESMHAANRRAQTTALELMRKQADLEHEIDERRQAQQAHVDLLRRLVCVQEEERRRISRELHDQCGQDLTAMRLGLKFLEESTASSEQSGRQIKSLRDLVDQVARETHHIAMELRPPALDELGLQMAVDGYVKSWSLRTGIPVDIECQGMNRERVPADVETALYRILQEALTNVAKHSHAKRVSVVLERTEAGVLVIIEDEGQGFDVTTLSSGGKVRQHLGVLGMRERIEAVGGTLEIESVLGSGTTVFARVPLPQESETKQYA